MFKLEIRSKVWNAAYEALRILKNSCKATLQAPLRKDGDGEGYTVTVGIGFDHPIPLDRLPKGVTLHQR